MKNIPTILALIAILGVSIAALTSLLSGFSILQAFLTILFSTVIGVILLNAGRLALEWLASRLKGCQEGPEGTKSNQKPTD